MLVFSSCSVLASHCNGLSWCRAWAQGTWAAIAVAHWRSGLVACGIFLDQGSNPCPLHWQAYSWPLDHQGSLLLVFVCLWYFLTDLMLAQLLSFPRSVYLFIFFWFHMNRTGFPEHYPFAGSVGTMPFNNGPSNVWDDRNACICSQEGSSSVILPMHTLCSFAKCPKDLFSLHCHSQLSLIIKKIQRQVLKLKERNSTQTAHFIQWTKNYFQIPNVCQALL